MASALAALRTALAALRSALAAALASVFTGVLLNRSLSRTDLPDRSRRIVELGPPDLARALDHDIGDPRRVDRELPLHALALDDPADDEHLASPTARAGDHHAVVNLDTLLVALKNAHVDIDRITDLELGHRRLHTAFFNNAQQSILHGSFLSGKPSAPGRRRRYRKD